MDFLLDTASLDKVRECYEIINIRGVTTNPSILARSGRSNPYVAVKELRDYLKDKGGELHVQTLSNEKGGIVREAETMLELYGRELFVKVPATREGLKAIKALSAEGVRVTATCILSYSQALMAALNGAKVLAVYCNRMESAGVDYADVIKDIKKTVPEASVLGASFRTFSQVRRAFLAGADCCTLDPGLLLSELDKRPVKDIVAKFETDWDERFGEWSAAALMSLSGA